VKLTVYRSIRACQYFQYTDINTVGSMLLRYFCYAITIILFSCTGKEPHSGQIHMNSEKTIPMPQQGEKTDPIRLSNKIDSIVVSCYFFGKNSNKSYTIHSSGTIITVYNLHNQIEKFEIESIQKKNQFVNYINLFYIEKTEHIIKNRLPIKDPIITDYPTIIVNGFKNGKEVLSQTTSIGEESFQVEFNPKYIEFYKFLGKLISNE